MAGTVVVACKMPNGIILELPNAAGDPTPFARLKGYSQHYGAYSPDVVAMAGLTHNVDADKWAQWLALASVPGKEYGPVRDGLIFAMAKQKDVEAVLLETSNDIPSLAEPRDPANPGDGLLPDKAGG